MNNTLQPTVSGSALQSILTAFQQMNLDVKEIKARAGIDQFDLADPHLRVSCHYASRCYQIAQQLWKGEHFGLQHGRMYQPFSLGIIGHLLATADNCQQALNCYERYQRAFGEGLIFESRPYDIDQCRSNLYLIELDIHPKLSGSVDSLMIDSFFVALKNCASLLTGIAKPLAYVELRREPPVDPETYTSALQCPVYFSQKQDRIFISSELMEQPLLSANSSLFIALEDQMLKSNLHGEGSFAETVRTAILKSIDGRKITLARIAEQLAMTPRTLQRRLKQSEHRFQDLLDKVRLDFSVKEVRENKISHEELAYLLGYSEPSTFRKAFKQWTGKTPREYQQQH
ncbi:AraC family transcriptional regulator [Pseudoteredinibacter isoporae]|uniref:AraC family transcriptional regulator n=1 Tax=Pseudoteredinibacter isoporae TaxID=570281 RepID=UPI003109A418